jgi:hypothetical protein
LLEQARQVRMSPVGSSSSSSSAGSATAAHSQVGP